VVVAAALATPDGESYRVGGEATEIERRNGAFPVCFATGRGRICDIGQIRIVCGRPEDYDLAAIVPDVQRVGGSI
jgi:hypothetical protein